MANPDLNSPLKDLYADKNAMPVLMYPSDLGSAKKGHYITFSILIPTKSTYKAAAATSLPSISFPTEISNAQTALNSMSTAASQAAATASSATSTIGSALNTVNQAVTTAATTVASVAAVAGVITGTASILSSAVSTGSVGGFVSTASTLTSLGTTVTSIPGVSSFLNDPMKASSDAFKAIKNFVSGSSSAQSPAKLVSGGAKTVGLPIFNSASMKPSGYINLYMPDTVSMAQHAAYGDISETEVMGALGGASEGMREGDAFKNAFTSLYDNWDKSDIPGSAIRTYKNAQSGALQVPPIALEGAGGLLGKTGLVNSGAGISKLLLKNAGYAINPQFEVIFTQMDFRKFQFDFTFTPKSPAEAQSVREIIKLFRVHSSPSNPSSGAGRYFVTPSVFKIEYMHKEKTNDNLHKFAPCVLETVIVDYAPEVGWVAFEDGMPVKTRLTLQFKETEIITQESITGDTGY